MIAQIMRICELTRHLPHVISFLVIRLKIDSTRGSVFWPLLLGGWLPTLLPSCVVLVETLRMGEIARLDLPEEQHNNNKKMLSTIPKSTAKVVCN